MTPAMKRRETRIRLQERLNDLDADRQSRRTLELKRRLLARLAKLCASR